MIMVYLASYHLFDRAAYRRRRIATRYDKPVRNFIAAIQLAATNIWWAD
ncbi:hypothetical protein PWG15_06885 [Ensifer adhaerens]|nr:hypothetical protein [Ensifer adhaerens]WDZ78217.1 hypothetical protein PWG15_06885 [Ensifer adhaerens]